MALGTLESSVVGTARAFPLYLQGVSDVGGVRASLLACTEPVSAALCAALWLHTSFAWQDLLGFAAILVMAVLIALPERHRGVERDRDPPRLREHEQHHAADEHPAARADAHGIAPKQIARQERIEHQRHRRAQAPEERLRRERERGQAAMGRKQKSAEEREHERSALAPRRQAARTQAHPK